MQGPPALTADDWNAVLSSRIATAREHIDRASSARLGNRITLCAAELVEARAALDAACAWVASDPPEPPKLSERGA